MKLQGEGDSELPDETQMEMKGARRIIRISVTAIKLKPDDLN